MESRRASVPRGAARNIWIAGLVSLLTDISSEMLVPVLPLFLANVLGAPAGAIGLIEGAASMPASLMKAFSGWFSDRIGRTGSARAAGGAP